MDLNDKIQLIEPPWSDTFYKLVSDARNSVWFIVPFIKQDIMDEVLHNLHNSVELRILTRIDKETFAKKTSDKEALIAAASRPRSEIRIIGNLHAKVYIFDKKVAIIGSQNLSKWGMADAIELGLIIEDEAFIENNILPFFEKYWSVAEKVSIGDLVKNVQIGPTVMPDGTDLREESIDNYPSDSRAAYFRNLPLDESEAAAMMDLERATGGRIIPEVKVMNNITFGYTSPLDAMKFHTFGFSVSQEHVINLSLSGAYNLKPLPDSIGELKSLQELYLGHNQLIFLPETIGELKSLQILDLNWNLLRSLPETIGGLESLQFLDISYNQNRISSLPDSIGALKLLQVLKMRETGLKLLPESIGELESLQELDLFRNRLISIPKSIGKLKSLKTLNLSYNQLASLPETIGALSSLQSLSLHDNQLSSLPNSIKRLRSLKSLDLKNNQFTSLPDSISIALKNNGCKIYT